MPTQAPSRITHAALSGWGRNPIIQGYEVVPADAGELADVLEQPYLPRGQGRSYGDAGLPAANHRAINTARLDRMLSFNPYSGVLDAEAGVTLKQILSVALPRGFFLPVTPGTMCVSLGGAIASNVHGKNHHRAGSIEHFILEIEVATPTGNLVCTPDINRELFRASLGGYGLTGLITRAKLKLKPVESAEVEVRRLRASNLDKLFRLFLDHDDACEYSVAWLDTLARGANRGRGILMLGNHAKPNAGRASGDLVHREKAKLKVPFAMPDFLLNRPVLTAFNALFYGMARFNAGFDSQSDTSPRWTPSGQSGAGASSVGARREGFEGFFYPLDRIHDWNLLYGKRGFFQYQCVIPDPRGEEGIAMCLKFLSDNRLGAFLSVLKRCGDDEVMLPFCKKGYTLALDIPFRGPETLRLLDKLDTLVLDYQGRVYLTKDARLPPETFRAMYPEWRAWMAAVRTFNPDGKSNSRLAERLKLWNA